MSVVRWMPLALVLGACGPQLVKTPADVFRIDGGVLRTCTLMLGWTVEELTLACGIPDKVVAWAAGMEGDQCAIYRSHAHSFGVAGAAPVLAACLSKRDEPKRGGLSARGEERKVRQVATVVAVYGLAALEMTPLPDGSEPSVVPVE